MAEIIHLDSAPTSSGEQRFDRLADQLFAGLRRAPICGGAQRLAIVERVRRVRRLVEVLERFAERGNDLAPAEIERLICPVLEQAASDIGQALRSLRAL